MSEEVSEEEVKRVIHRTLSIEEDNLHYKRPPTIIQDIKNIVEEEVDEIDMDGE
jgi:hypothetical protein